MIPALKLWLRQARANFLALAVLLVLIGGAVAASDGVFDALAFGLSMVGVVLAHAAVNLFNEHSDDLTGIDKNTRRTPFTGGSGVLQEGGHTPRAVFAAAAGALMVALLIGIFLAWRAGWALLGFMIPGGLAAIFYTTHLARWMLGELSAGVCLGSLVVMGSYYAQAGTLTPAVALLSIPPGILTALLLLLNEFPDVGPDRAGGRRHLVIALGWRGAAVVYALSLAAMYLVLVIGAALRFFPWTVLLGLLTLPLSIKAAATALRHGGEFEKMIPALGANVGVVLATDLLLAVAYFLA
jgi:1,4-dihydroxy-2-naphthoate octaprenyltransferase